MNTYVASEDIDEVRRKEVVEVSEELRPRSKAGLPNASCLSRSACCPNSPINRNRSFSNSVSDALAPSISRCARICQRSTC